MEIDVIGCLAVVVFALGVNTGVQLGISFFNRIWP